MNYETAEMLSTIKNLHQFNPENYFEIVENRLIFQIDDLFQVWNLSLETVDGESTFIISDNFGEERYIFRPRFSTSPYAFICEFVRTFREKL